MTAPLPGMPADRLTLLYRISETFNSSLDLSEILNRVIDEVIAATNAERGFLMLRDDEDNLAFRAARGIDQRTIDVPEFQVSRGLVEMVAREGRPRLVHDAMSDRALSGHSSVVGLGLRSVMCVPMQLKGRTIGVVYVDNRKQTGRFSAADLELVTAIAASAAIACENARLHRITVERYQEIDNPYIIGVPLTEHQSLFVGRRDISARIEQLLRDPRRPPLMLFGQRRIGKTSLLHNLGRLLPEAVTPLFVDLQGPASQASDHAGFLYNIARGMIDSANRRRGLSLPALARESLAADPFTRFDEWLDEVERSLGSRTALLALDEFETLEHPFADRRFDESAVLGMLRHWGQHRSRLKLLLAGSRTMDELHRWAAYLINVQAVQIGYLKESEVRRLVERPVTHFALQYEAEARERVFSLTRGHPFLVQLLCAEIVSLKNEQEPAVRRRASLADVEAAAREALEHGAFFFADIGHNQIDVDGSVVLSFLAGQGEGAQVDRDTLTRRFAADPDPVLKQLVRRDLIEAVDGGYRFQVELIRRWFAQHAE